TRLVSTHGVEPGSALQHLHQQILQNDPTLIAPQSGPAPTPVAEAAPAAFGWAAPPPPQAAPQYWPSETPVHAGEPETLKWQDWAVKFAAAAVPIISVGMLAGPLVGVLAIRRRSVRLGAAAVGYLAATVTGALLIDTSSDEIISDTDGLGVALVIATALICAIQVGVIVPRRKQAPGLDPRRQYARQLAAEHPRIARQLGIGRPDLPNQFEDGGLIDINGAPEPVLRTLPGVSAEQAALIVADRTHRGPFRSVEDLSARGLFPSPIPPQVAEALLIIRVEDTVDEDRR
ncbi:MAG TPA: helix-hairpin-helix domain-containing protein, partial [Kribbella sp.]|nr:helix-hairpin-helix domain-containing protein [Kribbella sp.]